MELNDDLQKLIDAEVARQERYDTLINCMSADNLRSRPTQKQLDVFKSINSPARYRYYLGGNQSGKTSIILRELVWVLEGKHPYWTKPIDHICNNKLCRNENTEMYGDATTPKYRCPKCGNTWRIWDRDEPMNIIIAGQDHKNLLLNIWQPRIKPLLTEPDIWREVKVSNQYIGWVENKNTGDRLLFYPHGHGEEKVRKGVQGFTIHFVYFDELAPMPIIEELQRRVDAKMGYFTAAYSMKKTDPAVIRMQNGQLKSGAAQIAKFSKFDNPVYAGDVEREMAKLAGLPKEKIDAILYGDLEDLEDNVFSIDELQVKEHGLPETYSYGWRHVEIVDPAIKGTTGYVVVAQNPSTGIWHTVQAEYIKGTQDVIVLYKKVVEARNRIPNRNFVRFISDSQPWFTSIARRTDLGVMSTTYKIPPNKQSRIGGKVYLIKRFQGFVSEGRLRIDNKFDDLWNELLSYRWKEGSKEDIVNSHKFHIIDCMMYFVDCLPPAERDAPVQLTMNELTRLYTRDRIASKPGSGGTPPQLVALRPAELNRRLKQFVRIRR